MNFSLIICTYQRPKALLRLLHSVMDQVLYPAEIIIVDSSEDRATKESLKKEKFPNLEYYRLGEQYRGLAQQRNFGISKVKKTSEIICFLDDDIVLIPTYFENLIGTYSQFPNAIGIGGYILEKTKWGKKESSEIGFNEFAFDGWTRPLGSRNVLRKKLGLLSNKPPGFMPDFSHGFSTGFLPPSGKIYPVEFFMGGVSSFRKSLFEKIGFSSYFEGYGLYEDMDFCLRASKTGQLYVNTAATLFHHHEETGRPNSYKYGKMVLRNGWYVWRTKKPNPSVEAQFKWQAISFLLTLVRLGNIINTHKRKEVLFESLGRISGWWGLLIDKPEIEQ